MVAVLACGVLGSLLPFGAVVGPLVMAPAAVGLAVVLVRFVDRQPVAALGLHLNRAGWRGSLAGFGIVAAVVGAATLIAIVSGLTEPPAADGRLPVGTMLLAAFVVQGFPEELLFRGYLVQSARARLPVGGVVALSALVFGVPHLLSGSGAQNLGQRLLFLLIPIGFAVIATLLRLRTGSVWPAVAVHAGFHVSFWAAGAWVHPAQDTYGAYLAVMGGVMLAAAALTGLAVRERPAKLVTA